MNDTFEMLNWMKERESWGIAESELIIREQYIETMKDAIQIAEIYRVNLQSISRSIEETILPELGFVKSFLIAEDVKNKLLLDEEIIEVRPEVISLYKYTI